MQSNRSTSLPKALDRLLQTLENRKYVVWDYADNPVQYTFRSSKARNLNQWTQHQQRLRGLGGGWKMKSHSEIRIVGNNSQRSMNTWFNDEDVLPQSKEIYRLAQDVVDENSQIHQKEQLHEDNKSDQKLRQKLKRKPKLLPTHKTEKNKDNSPMGSSFGSFSVFSSDNSTDNLESIIKMEQNFSRRRKTSQKCSPRIKKQSTRSSARTRLKRRRDPSTISPVNSQMRQNESPVQNDCSKRASQIKEKQISSRLPQISSEKILPTVKKVPSWTTMSYTIFQSMDEEKSRIEIKKRRLKRERNSVQANIDRIRNIRKQSVWLFPVSFSKQSLEQSPEPAKQHTTSIESALLQKIRSLPSKKFRNSVLQSIPLQPTEVDLQMNEPLKIPKHMKRQKLPSQLINMQKSVKSQNYQNTDRQYTYTNVDASVQAEEPVEFNIKSIIDLEKHSKILQKPRNQLQECIYRKSEQVDLLQLLSKPQQEKNAAQQEAPIRVPKDIKDKRKVILTRNRSKQRIRSTSRDWIPRSASHDRIPAWIEKLRTEVEKQLKQESL